MKTTCRLAFHVLLIFVQEKYIFNACIQCARGLYSICLHHSGAFLIVSYDNLYSISHYLHSYALYYRSLCSLHSHSLFSVRYLNSLATYVYLIVKIMLYV